MFETGVDMWFGANRYNPIQIKTSMNLFEFTCGGDKKQIIK